MSDSTQLGKPDEPGMPASGSVGPAATGDQLTSSEPPAPPSSPAEPAQPSTSPSEPEAPSTVPSPVPNPATGDPQEPGTEPAAPGEPQPGVADTQRAGVSALEPTSVPQQGFAGTPDTHPDLTTPLRQGGPTQQGEQAKAVPTPGGDQSDAGGPGSGADESTPATGDPTGESAAGVSASRSAEQPEAQLPAFGEKSGPAG